MASCTSFACSAILRPYSDLGQKLLLDGIHLCDVLLLAAGRCALHQAVKDGEKLGIQQRALPVL